MIEVLEQEEALLHHQAIAGFLHDILTSWPFLQPVTLEECEDRLAATFVDEKAFAVVVMDDGDIVGATVRFPEGDGWMRSMFMYVHPDYRGQGLMDSMYARADREVLKRGFYGTRAVYIIRDGRDPRKPKGWRPSIGVAEKGYIIDDHYIRRTWIDIGDKKPTIKVFGTATMPV